MRKYTTEFGLNVYTSYKTVIPAAHLEILEKVDSHKYHIYGILLAPKVFIKEESVVKYRDYFSIILFAYMEDKYTEYTVNVKLAEDLDHRKVCVKSTYPHTLLKLTIEDDEWCNVHSIDNYFELHAMEVFDQYAVHLMPRIKYKVLYIGQSYGKRGERSAIERLSSHETLQKILIDVQRNYPEYEIKIMLLEMECNLGVGIDTITASTKKSDEEDRSHIEAVLSHLPEEQQIINITEAAMINYFKPPYNSTFVENFPCPKHKSYKQYYELDYNDLTIELDMEFDCFPDIELFTDTARIASVWDFIHYQLENDSERDSMYSMFRDKRQ